MLRTGLDLPTCFDFLHDMTTSFSLALRRGLARWLAPMQNSGNNHNQQPPDLDELWRDFNQKLGQLFGGKGGQRPPERPPEQGGGGHGQQPQVIVIPVVPIVLGAGLLIWLASGTFIVQEGQQAVVSRLGKLHHTVGPGVGWRYPWPIERAEIVDVTQLRSIEIGSSAPMGNTGLLDSSMLTRDENIVDVRLTVQYNLKNAASFLFNNVNAEAAVAKAAESAVREVVGRVNMDTVLNKDREAIQRDVMRSTQAQLDRYQTGVLIRNVNIQNVQPPAAVQAAFDDALKAGQDRDRLKNQGQAYANRIIAEAKGQAARMSEEAEGYKARVLGQAKGDAERFEQIVAQYQKAPQVTRDRLYTDAMQELYGKTTKILVDSKGNNLINIPLDKLAAGKAAEGSSPAAPAAAAAAHATAGAATNANTTTGTDARSRDDLRSRSREAH